MKATELLKAASAGRPRLSENDDNLEQAIINAARNSPVHLAAVLRKELPSVPDFLAALEQHVEAHTLTGDELSDVFALLHRRLVRLQTANQDILQSVDTPIIGQASGRIALVLDNYEWVVNYTVEKVWSVNKMDRLHGKTFTELNAAIAYIEQLVKDAS
jgi:DNA polymerase III delta prime subunit